MLSSVSLILDRLRRAEDCEGFEQLSYLVEAQARLNLLINKTGADLQRSQIQPIQMGGSRA